VRLHEVDNPHLEVVKHADLQCMEKVRLREVARNAGNVSNHIAMSESMLRRQFGIVCIDVCIAERSTYVVILLGVLVVTIHIIFEFVLWTLRPRKDMLLEMTYVAILWAIRKPCCYNQFASPDVAICTEKVVIPTPGAGMLVKGEW
jgi:hypothetical protein